MHIISVPRKVAVGVKKPFSDSLLFINSYMGSKFLVDNDNQDIQQPISGSLEFILIDGALIGLKWKLGGGISDEEVVTHIFSIPVYREGIELNLLPCCVVNVGNMPYQSMMLGKEGFETWWCNYCNLIRTDFGKKQGKLWTMEDLTRHGQDHIDNIKQRTARGVKTMPKGNKGVRNIPLLPIPPELYYPPSLHLWY